MVNAYGVGPGPQGGSRSATPLREFWNFLLRNRLAVLGMPVLVVGTAVLFTLLVTPTYDATATIEISERRSSFPVLEALESLSERDRISTDMEVLRSRTLAEDVVDSLGLQLTVQRPRRARRADLFTFLDVDRTAPESEFLLRRGDDGRFTLVDLEDEHEVGRYTIGELVDLPGARLVLAPGAAEHEEILFSVARLQDAVKQFRGTVVVARPNREADIVVVRYEGSDPELVPAVVNTMAGLFIRGRRAARTVEARSTVRFMGEQVDTLTGQLTLAEERLRSFREGENVISLDAEAKEQIRWLADIQGERDMFDAERAALQRLLDEVIDSAAVRTAADASPYRRLMGFPTLLQNFAVSELFRSLSEVENQRAELLSRRTPVDPDVQVLTGRIAELETQLRAVAETYLQGRINQVQSMDETLDRFRTELSRIPAREIRFARLRRQAGVLEEIYTMLQTRLKEAEIIAAVEDGSVRVVDPAIVPNKPIKPSLPLNVVIGLALGLVMGVGAAFVRENMDTTLHTREDLQLVTGGAPVLAVIPRIREAAGNGRPSRVPAIAGAPGGAAFESRLVTGRDPRNPVSEAYRSLRTNITFSRPEQAPKTVVFTSPTPGDGKSTTASNLAITLAQQELRCLLVDSDMRRGFLHDVFRVRRTPGLSDLLLGRASFTEVVARIDLDPGALDFIATGTLPPNPAELIGSPRMQALLTELAGRYDAVILDAPPLNLVTDGALLGTYADGLVLVARAGVTDRGAISYALEQIAAVRAPLLGTVLNDSDQRKERHYGSYSASAHASYYGMPADG